MPKVKAKILQTVTKDGQLLAKVQFDKKMPPSGSWITAKWGAVRSSSQNSLYWVFLNWLIKHGGLEEYGHFCPKALHMDLKAHFISENVLSSGQFKAIEEGTTTDLTKDQFSEYIQSVDMFVQSFFEIDTSAFWEEKERNYSA